MEESINLKNKFRKLLEELIYAQGTEMKCDVQLYARDSKELISQCVNEVKDQLSEQAKQFGANINKLVTEYEGEKITTNNLIKQYKTTLEQAKKPFDDQIKEVTSKRITAQSQLVSLIANFVPALVQQQGNSIKTKTETAKAFGSLLKCIKEGKLDEAKTEIDNIQSLRDDNQSEAFKTFTKSTLEQMKDKIKTIRNCIDEELSTQQKRAKAINDIKFKKQMALSKVQKQNIFQKIVGSLFSKFNGSKKFIQNAVDPLKDTIKEIKETHLPNIQADVADRMAKFQEELKHNRETWEASVAKKVDEYAQTLATTKEEVIGDLKSIKAKLSSGIKSAVETAQIEAMIADDIRKMKINDIKSFGRGVQENAKDKIQAAKNWGADKIETAQIYGMLAKDKVVATKDAIIQGAVNIKNGVVQGASDVKKGAVKIATDTRDGIANTAVSAKNLIEKGAYSISDAGKSTYKSLINRGIQIQMNIITKMQNRLDAQQKRIQEKMDKLNPNNSLTEEFVDEYRDGGLVIE